MSAIYLKRFNYSVPNFIDTLRIDIMQPKHEIIERRVVIAEGPYQAE